MRTKRLAGTQCTAKSIFVIRIPGTLKIADVLNCPVDYLLGRTDDSLVLQTQDNSNVTVSETNQDSSMDTHVSLSDDITEMSEMIKKLPLVKRSEVILMIHKMLEEQ